MRYNKLQDHSNMALFKSLGMFLATTPLPHPYCHTAVSSAITSPPLLIYLYKIGSVYSAWPPLHLVVTLRGTTMQPSPNKTALPSSYLVCSTQSRFTPSLIFACISCPFLVCSHSLTYMKQVQSPLVVSCA